VTLACLLIGHRGVITDSIPLDPPDLSGATTTDEIIAILNGPRRSKNVWVQETCSRCGKKRRYITHSWGVSEPSPWR
jgi:hypothetical protein